MNRRIVISGSSGFLGRALSFYFTSKGDTVIALHRTESGWSPLDSLEGADAVINLAGRPIQTYWTHKVKREIYESRVEGTRRLVDAIEKAKQPPRVLISASAVGLYGDRGEEVLGEGSRAGDGFLSHVAHDWEEAARASCRVVHTRFGLVLGKEGGLLSRMIPIFRCGFGSVLGSGRQWISWVGLQDLVRLMEFAIEEESLSGPVNVVSHHPVRARAFAEHLATSLHRPCLFRIPAWVLRLFGGEMASELLLSSTRVLPDKLDEIGFHFNQDNLKDILPFD